MVRGYVPELVGDGVGWPAKVLERHRAEEQEPLRHRPLHVQARRNSAQQVRNASISSIATKNFRLKRNVLNLFYIKNVKVR